MYKKMTVLAIGLAGLTALVCAHGQPREELNINPVWRFSTGDPVDASKSDFDDSGWDVVSVPHTHRVIASTLANFETEGRLVGWYRRTVDIPADALEGKVFILFQGAMESTKLWVNGEAVGEYAVSGYDTFHFDITDHLRPGKNKLAVRVDNTEQPTLPPDGEKRDFVLFGGLYRDVELIFTGKQYVTFPWESAQAGLRVTLPEVSEQSAVVKIETSIRNDAASSVGCVLATHILDREGKVVAQLQEQVKLASGAQTTVTQTTAPIGNPHLWSPESPYLYSIETTVKCPNGLSDRLVTPLGIRWVEWTKDRGFFLNGKRVKLVGTNRHQTKPFVGNAVPNSWHRRDAERLKAMGCNWVRLSHYPHDPDFLDDLDELGIMALAEGPTWMNIPSDEWVVNLDKSFRRMIRRDRNRPSMIIWNACINHQKKHPVLVKAAREEDPTRARGQDTVPAPMDFRHKNLSGDGALCIEHTGHTFNTFRGQGGNLHREYQLAKRHWEHTDASYKKKDNSGLASWSMFDYNTPHYGKPFYAAPHGIFDLFEIPKLTYWWHLSELGEKPITYGALIEDEKVCVFANADQLRFAESLDGQTFRDIDDVQRVGDTELNHPPYYVKVSKEAKAFQATGFVDGQRVSRHVFYRQDEPASLALSSDSESIVADGADITRVVVKLVDKNGTVIVNDRSHVEFSIEGEGRLIGENPTMLRAGQYIILVQANFVPGAIKVNAKLPDHPEITPGSVAIRTVPVSDPTVDMPNAAGLKPAADTIVAFSSMDLELGLADVAGDYNWFTLPTRAINVPINEIVEAPAIMVATDKEEIEIQARGIEYRIYSSEWTKKPGKLKNGDAVFFRIKTSSEYSKWTAGTVTIDGITRKWRLRTEREPAVL